MAEDDKNEDPHVDRVDVSVNQQWYKPRITLSIISIVCTSPVSFSLVVWPQTQNVHEESEKFKYKSRNQSFQRYSYLNSSKRRFSFVVKNLKNFYMLEFEELKILEFRMLLNSV